MRKTEQQAIRWVLLIALLLRLVYALAQPDHLAIYTAGGGDSGWYLANGAAFYSGQTTGIAHGIRYDLSVLPNPPLYFLFVGFWQQLLPPGAAVVAIRIAQSLMGAALVWFVYRYGRALLPERRVGLWAAAVVAVHPAFVMEPAAILRETLYVFLVGGALWLYIDRYVMAGPCWRWLLIVGSVLGLATLTREVLVLFPLGLAGHVVLLHLWPRPPGGARRWRRALVHALGLLIAYGLVVGAWTAYNLVRYDRLVIASSQFVPAVWRGAVAGDGSPADNDALLGDATYAGQAAVVIGDDPGGYVMGRLRDWGLMILEPHGLVGLGDESLRAWLVAWVADGFSLAGFVRLVSAEAFALKLSLYVLHLAALIGGIIGAWWWLRARWRVAFVLLGFIAYTYWIHLPFALPRYFFPAEAFWWPFAIAAWLRLAMRWPQREEQAHA